MFSIWTVQFFFTACSGYLDLNLLNAVNFNNSFVDYVDEVATLTEESYGVYEKDIPDVIRPGETVSLGKMEVYTAQLKEIISRAEDLKKLKSRNKSQEKGVQDEFLKYIAAFSVYSEIYEDVELLYAAKEYETRGDAVSEMNQKLNKSYEDFVAVHENFVMKTLPSFAGVISTDNVAAESK